MEPNDSFVNKNMESNASIGARLRSERERVGLNQESLAGPAGVTRQSQSKYEKGERSPDALYLSAVAQAGIDVQYVLTGQRASFNLERDHADKDSIEISYKSEGYQNLKPESELSTSVPTLTSELETGAQRWLAWYYQILPDDMAVLEPSVEAMAARGIKKKSQTG